MESIGDKLRQKREELSLSIDQVARDTNIAKAYLVALENEKFEEFPGETYLVGFLRNYSEYLGLNAEDVISLYKSFKIQEQPIPMDELLESPKIPWAIIGVIALVLVILGAGAFLLFPDVFLGGRSVTAETAVQSETKPVIEPADELESAGPVIVMDEDILEQRFEQGTVIRFAKGDSIYEMDLAKIDTDITLESGDTEFILGLGQEEMLDLDNSGDPDIYVLVRDIDGAAAVIRFDRQVVPVASDTQETEPAQAAENAQEAATPEAQPASTTTAVGNAQVSSREKKPNVIMKEEKSGPFTLMIQFRGNCLVRYEIDDQSRKEQYFTKDKVLQLDVMKEVRLWLSNGGNASAKISGNPVEFGKPGEVSVGIIRWERNAGAYELTLVPVY